MVVKTFMLHTSHPKSLACICPDPPYCCDDVVNAAEGDGDVSKLAEVPVAKRKGVKRPQPKLDSQRYERLRGLVHQNLQMDRG